MRDEPHFSHDISAVQAIGVVPTILDTLCKLTGMGFAAVARVTEERWIACQVQDNIAFGLQPGSELDIKSTICHEIRTSGQEVVIDDVDNDPLYCNHHTPLMYGFKSYISVPIRLADGAFFGTLCAIDPGTNHVSRPEIVNTFRMFANLIALHLKGGERIEQAEESLMSEQRTAQLREQFIAVLGHDLRNPLASLTSGVVLLAKEPLTERGRSILTRMRQSGERMSLLIENILDFARGRLGRGVDVERRLTDIAGLVEEVVAEIQIVNPDRTIQIDCEVNTDVRCDAIRVAQLLSNLLGNAITHGDPAQPIDVECTVADHKLLLSVANGGTPIPAIAQLRLFEPFERGTSTRDGLGLGLFISQEIARAHGGTLLVASSEEQTKFTFEMPL
jgi:signal transduction histidine kinase